MAITAADMFFVIIAPALMMLLSPFAPHIAEEIWQGLGFTELLTFQGWPEWNETMCKQLQVQMVVQINGKMKTLIEMSKEDSMDQANVEQSVAENQRLSDLKAKLVTRVVFVPGKLINFVV